MIPNDFICAFFMPKAVLEFHEKRAFSDGTIREMKIWRLPQPTAERPHGYKYSLFYGRPGERLICYDNERGKGDHRHVGDVEEKYDFKGLDRLIIDFTSDVGRARRSR